MPERAHIIVVDDHTVTRKTICALLRAQPDFAVVCDATNGTDAVIQAKQLQPGVVVLDISTPGMDGLEFIRKVRSELKDLALPIIIVSTKGADEDVQLGMNLGASGYLSKPISMARLKELVTNFLGEH